MRILEDNELNYSIDDIIDAVNEELGFSMIKSGPTKGYFMLGNKIKASVDFTDEITVELEFPKTKLDMMKEGVLAEAYAAAIESVDQIIDIIERMTGEVDENDEDTP